MTTNTLPTIATFTTYARGTVETFGVTRATVSVSGRGGDWGLKIVITVDNSEAFGREQFGGFVPGGRHYRHAFTTSFRTRELAKRAASSFLRDHLGDAFTGAAFKVNGRDKGTL